ncbi:MAG: ABC transporter permease [Lachnospiraceae bacterium]|nr:ABC transporter permease [Lachnospiraceae bacterium]
MNIKTRLFRKPITTSLWFLLCTAVSAFLLVGLSLWFSTSRLSQTLNESHTAIAVRTDQPAAGEKRYFTQADTAYFESLPEVKAVRSHTVSAAFSPSFLPIIEISRAHAYRSNGNPLPYSQAMFLGRLHNIEKTGNILYIHMVVAPEKLLGEDYIRGEVGQVIDYQRIVTLAINLKGGDDAETFFEKGKIYQIAGMLDSGAYFSRSPGFPVVSNKNPGHQILFGGYARQEGEGLMGYLPSYGDNQEPNPTYAFPLAKYVCEAEEYSPETNYLEQPDPFWDHYKLVWEKQQHSLPVVGTDRLESLYVFLTNRLSINEGRSFTKEEYESGAKVLILSEKMAARNGLKVGDTLTLQQYNPAYETPHGMGYYYLGFLPAYPKNNPTIDFLNLHQHYEPEQEFTLVGIYRMAGEWGRGTYDVTPNTVFMPRKTQISGAVGEIPAEEGQEDLYGILLSIELQNGRVNDFMLKMDQSRYKDQFYPFDQGYEEVQKGINSMADSMLRLFILSAAAFLLFLILYLLMFQGAERKNLGTMRSLGQSPARTGAYLFCGGFAVAAAGVIAGTSIGAWIINRVQKQIEADALANINTSARGASVLGKEALQTMVQESGLEGKTLLLLGGAQLLLILILLALQALKLSRQNARRLMEG